MIFLYTKNTNKLISNSKYCQIYKSNEDQNVVLKFYNKKHIYSPKNIYNDEFLKLINTSENLIHIFNYFEQNNSIPEHITMEWINGGDLYDYINEKNGLSSIIIENDKISNKSNIFVKKIIKQILLGLEVLHTNGYIHGDIKPENIMIQFFDNFDEKDNFNIKIIDYDFVIKKNKKNKQISGTPGYFAPEIFFNMYGNKTIYNEKIDIWSLGMTLFICMEAKFPLNPELYEYENIFYDILLYQENIENTKSFFNYNRKIWDNDILNFFNDMTFVNVEKRKNVIELLDYDFIKFL